eukprot:CAMPEP_0173421624 /NCGR_PEP_ID=MMETSP1357-20121228/2674_1 /TAXON_ID=77926 /ORGANISM="Hemiselmis rufescens, Strain PCC563" /LENGTH=152 /DNA_ID=CAMNT_0014384565 /DNA_START=24 /DNA_END=478 /DNA_ORIENTATION=+
MPPAVLSTLHLLSIRPTTPTPAYFPSWISRFASAPLSKSLHPPLASTRSPPRGCSPRPPARSLSTAHTSPSSLARRAPLASPFAPLHSFTPSSNLSSSSSCPVAYRTGAQQLADRSRDVEAHTAFIVGGMYGNQQALNAVIRRCEQEKVLGG